MISNILTKLIGNYKNFIIIALVSLFVTSCYTINTSSYSDKEFKGKKYNKICIYSLDENLVYRSLLEETLVVDLKEHSVDAIEGSELFPPTRKREESEFQSELLKNDIDGFLKFEVVYDNVNNERSEDDLSQKSYTSNGLNQSLRYRFEVVLMDVKTNKLAWIGSSEPFNYYEITQYNRDTFFSKLSRSVIDELQKKGHIK